MNREERGEVALASLSFQPGDLSLGVGTARCRFSAKCPVRHSRQGINPQAESESSLKAAISYSQTPAW
ncbi:MAG: hypothetical protein B6245_18730 [Desulfobacteraceae bacterium 4572_88]|nr:MAG: hypothetical protein B6245_18730 [Desulfobacteraceae bacterium 4572_88]